MKVETERRLKSLQKDLEKAETANKERALAVRYHKVKFFGESVSDPAHTATSHGVTENRAAEVAKEDQSSQETNASRRRSALRPSS